MKIFELDDLVKNGTIVPNMANIDSELAKVGDKIEVGLLPDGSNIGKVVLAIIDTYVSLPNGDYDMSLKGKFTELLDYMFHDGASEAYWYGILDDVTNNPIFNT